MGVRRRRRVWGDGVARRVDAYAKHGYRRLTNSGQGDTVDVDEPKTKAKTKAKPGRKGKGQRAGYMLRLSMPLDAALRAEAAHRGIALIDLMVTYLEAGLMRAEVPTHPAGPEEG